MTPDQQRLQANLNKLQGRIDNYIGANADLSVLCAAYALTEMAYTANSLGARLTRVLAEIEKRVKQVGD